MPYLFNYGSNNLKQLVKRIGKVSKSEKSFWGVFKGLEASQNS